MRCGSQLVGERPGDRLDGHGPARVRRQRSGQYADAVFGATCRFSGRRGSRRRGWAGVYHRVTLHEPDGRIVDREEGPIAAGFPGGRDRIATGQMHDEVHRLGVVDQWDVVDGPAVFDPGRAAMACPRRSARRGGSTPSPHMCSPHSAVVAGRPEVAQGGRAAPAARPTNTVRTGLVTTVPFGSVSIARYSIAVPAARSSGARSSKTVYAGEESSVPIAVHRAAGDLPLEW